MIILRIFKNLYREFRYNPRFILLYIVGLSLGIMGFVTVELLKSSLNGNLNEQSQKMLGADFGLSARRALTSKEKKLPEALLKSKIDSTEVVELYSMVANLQGDSKLIQIKGIEKKYPFYGSIVLDKESDLYSGNTVWAYPEVLLQLNIEIGDQIKIGEALFKVRASVLDDAAAGISTDMAPRIYMALHNLEKTKLLQPGSIAWHSILFKIPGKKIEILDKLRDDIFKEISEPDLKVYTHQNVGEMSGRLLGYLSDFLGITSLSSFLLAAIGSGFLFRSYIRTRAKSMAIFVSLGVPRKQTVFLYVGQFILLGLISSLLGYLMALLFVPLLLTTAKELTAVSLSLSFELLPLLKAILIGTLGSFFISLPLIDYIVRLNPRILLQGLNVTSFSWSKKQTLLVIPGLIFFSLLSFFQANSFIVTGAYLGGLVVAGIILAGVFTLLFKYLPRLITFKSLLLRWSFRDIERHRLMMISSFFAIGLGVLIVNIIPQLEATLKQELEGGHNSRLPSLFLFDIQDEQVAPLKKLLKKENIPLESLSPMVRAKLESVNGEDFNKGEGSYKKGVTREKEKEMRFRNRGFNLSYRGALADGDRIIKGRPLTPYKSGQKTLPEISIETRFADRLNLKMGDELGFDIQGVPVVGKIVNIRSVRWTTFKPNFFLIFSEGVLNEAPKTFLASLPDLALLQKANIQKLIVKEFPNISIIDVKRLVKKISMIMQHMGQALTMMSILCILVGLVVIYCISNDMATSRQWDIALLKSIGASFKMIQKLFILQFTIISFIAGLLGVLLSFIGSYLLSDFVFDSLWAYNGQTPFLVLFLTTLLTIMTTYFATKRGLAREARELLSN